MGKVAIVIFLAIFAVSGISLLYMTDKLDECTSLLGSFAQIFSSEIQQKCAKVPLFFLVIAIAWIFSGLIATMLIGIAIFQRHVFGGICYSIFMIIVILRLSGVI
ncbi:MAG: hypothetical protein AABZ36_05515 [Nitrospirota bacterium]